MNNIDPIQSFGHTASGDCAHLYTITNCHHYLARLTDYGASLVSFCIPYQTDFLDIVLGYDDVSAYETNRGQLGATVGRNANRLEGGRFTLNGISYQLQTDPKGNNSHSGPDFYGKRLWEMTARTESSVTFSLHSPHMDQGFPGNLTLKLTYSLTDDDTLLLTYEALSDRDTVLNVTNHSYFNLNGHGQGDVRSHHLWINSSQITAVSEQSHCPDGRLLPVADSSYDFRQMRMIQNDYDSNWCLDGQGYRSSARLFSPDTGLLLEMLTDMPGVQIYTGGGLPALAGKEHTSYGPHSGICLETQFYPNAINLPSFPQPILPAQTLFTTRTGYRIQKRKKSC